jgi:3-methyladenine DNA glycosylase AlkD
MFDSMISQLESVTSVSNKVSEQEYEHWKKLFSFDALRGKHYGKSFVDHFKIKDYRIYYERNWERCDTLIRSEWISNYAPCGV